MSRKIEDQMIVAIRAGQNFKLGNTEVRQQDNCTTVKLHGNVIAIIGHPARGTEWTLAAWDTNTTRSRINALARAFNWARSPYRTGGKLRAGGESITDTQWVNAL
jgi:hypothetical protein